MNDNNQMYEVLIQTITATSQLPFIKVNREEFLRTEFSGHEQIEKIIKEGPQSVFSSQDLRKKAQRIIDDVTNKSSVASFVAGIPSNPITAFASGGADIAQYFGFALNLSQQIAYLFGEDNLFDGSDNNLSDEEKIRIIAYLGIMFGASGSTALIANISKTAGKNLGKKVAQQALTKTAWYPLVKKIGGILGYKITKQTVGKTVTKVVPLLGGVISGGITYLTFKPMGNKLADTFEDLLNGKLSNNEELIKSYPGSEQELDDTTEIADAEFIEKT